MGWYLVITHEQQSHCWQLGDVSDERRDELIDRAKVLLGFPAGDGPLDPYTASPVQLSTSPPAMSCTRRLLSELDGVEPAAVAEFRGRCEVARREAHVQTARESLLRLTQDERHRVLTEVPQRPTSGGM